MAKLNWQKLTQDSKAQRDTTADWTQSRYDHIVNATKRRLLWPIGKHKGVLISKLSARYLCWASENLTGLAKRLADKELRHRYKAHD